MSELLDMSINDLADLPEFKPFPAGCHRAILGTGYKKINDKMCFEFTLKALETVELADPNDQPLVAGAETGVIYQRDNEYAQGKFKPLITELANFHGVSSIGEALEKSNGMEVTVVTKVRWNKDKTQSYTDIVNFVL